MRLRLRLLLLLLASSQLCNKKVIEKIFFPILSKDLFSKKNLSSQIDQFQKMGKDEKVDSSIFRNKISVEVVEKDSFQKKFQIDGIKQP